MEINLTFLITAICSFVLCLYIFFSRPQSKINVTFSLLVFFYALWVTSFLFFSIAGQTGTLIFWAKILHVSATLVPILLLYFSYFFPWENIPKSKLLNIIFISFPILLILLTIFSDLMFGSFDSSANSIGEKLTPKPAYVLYLIYYIIYASLTLINFIKKYHVSSGNQRDQIRYVLYSTCMATFFVVLVTVILPITRIYSFVWTGPFYILFAILMSAYAISKYELMDIRLIINRVGAWFFSVAFFGLMYLGLVAIYRNYILIDIKISFLLLTMLYGLIVGEMFLKVRLRLQRSVDQAFIRGWYDFEKAVAELSEKLAPITQRDVLFETIGSFIKEKLEVDQITLLSEELLEKHPYVGYLSQKRRLAFSNDDIKKKIRVSLADSHFAAGKYYLPIYSPAGIDALFILGEKASQDKYNDTDCNLFEFIQSQTTIILDRIRPYEKLEKDFQSSKKKLYDTDKLLARSEKIASMAGLIQEYNHEIRTPLSIMRSKVYLLPDDPTKIEDFKEVKKYLREQIDRAGDIVDTTLRLSEPKARKEIELNLNEVIENALRIYKPLGVKLTKKLNPLPIIQGDIEDLQLVFVNLFKNAGEAMQEGGELQVVSYPVIKDDEQNVCVEVSDTGVGIPEKNREKIFEPFFSTHVTKGRGLGLSIIFRIIREHLGKIEVESKVGMGSTFRVFLPALKD